MPTSPDTIETRDTETAGIDCQLTISLVDSWCRRDYDRPVYTYYRIPSFQDMNRAHAGRTNKKAPEGALGIAIC